jgi:lysylphosphatidylglycerol synthetase-like protein (DUF2156 family)
MMRAQHGLLAEATDAGLLGGSAVAFWFLVRDLLSGHPLRTPSVLGQVLLLGEQHPDVNNMVFGAVVLYTGFHFILFLVFATVVALLVRLSVEQAVVRFALLVLFVAFEFCFYVVINTVSEEVGALFPLWTVLAANLLASMVMMVYFWRRYPELKGILREEPLGA